MTEALDIQKVISTSTANVSLDALNKKGFKQVKVLNQTVISRLISEAVDRVLAEKSRNISKEERDRVLKETRAEFEALTKRRVIEERSKIGEMQKANEALLAELDALRKRQAQAIEIQAERDRALARVAALEGELAQLRDALTAAEKSLAVMEGQLVAKDQELERLSQRQGGAGTAAESLLSTINERLEKISQPAEVSQIMLSIDGLSRKLANISAGGGGVRSGTDATSLENEFTLDKLFSDQSREGIESNMDKVKVKQAAAGGVRGALAKLKKLQQGGEDGE